MPDLLSLSIVKSLQVYAIAAAISFFVAILIKVLVAVTGHIEKRRTRGVTAAPRPVAAPVAALSSPAAIADDVVAVITAAVAVAMGPHRILHIGESSHAWKYQGRSALHSHQPKR
ncbi:MAG: hypothetical protein LBU43_01100 [Candidatus Accumulibacter sp.]|jgi:hypothetical protein|nr:hypothetical protein [Accumulibacter sp.]